VSRAASIAAAVLAASLGGASAAAAETPSAPPAPEAPPAPSAAPAPGAMKLSLRGVGGAPPFAFAGARIAYEGVIAPYVAGQQVKVSIYRFGRKISVQRLSVLPAPGGRGRFRASFRSALPGPVEIRAAHYTNAAQGAFNARAPVVRFVGPNLTPGERGQSVGLLQEELYALHYAVPLDGVFDEATGRALVAYRKMTGLARIPSAGREVFARLARHAGAFHVRYPRDGRHVEGDLTRQVLVEVEAGGRVRAIYPMSSGKPSTPTVIGRFRVYLKTPGINSEGMVDSNYFIRGYAIHGYAEVPTYAASHGCLRVPIPDAPAIYAWVRTGTPVDVYYEDGGGSGRVRANAGP
jgi:peptidoglycan hydrolase-like protein with peptidoglycan-binding domain